MLPNQDAGSPIELPQYMANAPTICRFVELYASGEGIPAPVARFVLARNVLADVSLQSQRIGCRYVVNKILTMPSTAPHSSWHLEYSTSGVPRLCRNRKPSDVQISMAHSSAWLAVGLAYEPNIGIGVDIEEHHHRGNISAIGKYLGWQNHVSNLQDFYARWTLWEASAKSVKGSVLMKQNPGYDALCDVNLHGRLGGSGLWCGIQDVFGDVYFAIVLNGKNKAAHWYRNLRYRDLAHRDLDSSVETLCG